MTFNHVRLYALLICFASHHFEVRFDLLDHIPPGPCFIVILKYGGRESKVIYISDILVLQKEDDDEMKVEGVRLI